MRDEVGGTNRRRTKGIPGASTEGLLVPGAGEEGPLVQEHE
jgi:hypothetical protein